MPEIQGFLDTYGLAAASVLLLTKSVGVPLPIPADALMVVVAARVASGALVLWQAFLALLAALILGGAAQFLLARGPGRGTLYRFGPYLGLTPPRLDAATARVADAGPLAIGIGVLLPGVRAATVAACGLAGVPLRRFLPGLVLGSVLFLAVHFALGVAGWALLAPLGRAAGAVGWPVLIGLAVVAALVWLGVRRWQRSTATTNEVVVEAAGAWQEAACPVCLILGIVGPVFPIAHEEHATAAAPQPADAA